jgi:hypothetical protein
MSQLANSLAILITAFVSRALDRSLCNPKKSIWLTPIQISEFQTAPPTKRAKPDGIPVRLYDGALIAHVNLELADRLLQSGAAESFRNEPRRYLRLRRGISISRTERGWDIIEFLRMWHGDKRAAGYVAHKDRQSERLQYRPPSPAPERLRSIPGFTRRPASIASDQISKSEAPRDREAIAVLAQFTYPDDSVETPTPAERHYAPSEVAELWRFNVETIRQLFQDEPGVVVLQSAVKKGKRPYKTIRIPQSVLERVHKRLQR